MKIVDTIQWHKCNCGCTTVKAITLEPLVVVCEKCGVLLDNTSVIIIDLEDEV